MPSKRTQKNLTRSLSRLQASIGNDEDSAAKLKQIEMMLPMGRITEPKDIANAAWYLGSDQSSFVTGTMLEVDGGRGV
jgi:3-oxoacyl-[acyl-carrier protein] reductase